MSKFPRHRYLFAALLLFSCSKITIAGCFVNVQDIAFGNYDAAEAVPRTTSAEYMINCRGQVVATLELSSSNGIDGGRQRMMKHDSSSDSLYYNLFNDSGMSRPWGNGRQMPAPVVKIAGRKQGFIYGKVFARQDVNPGQYSDSIRLTILP